MELLSIDSDYTLANFFESVTTSTLSVQVIEPDDYPKYSTILGAWEKIASAKALAAEGRDKAIFNSCSDVCEMLQTELLADDHYSVHLCKDEVGPQGIMLLEERTSDVYVRLLVTNPINIRSTINAYEQNKSKGVGSTLMLEAEKIGLSAKKYAISVQPEKSSKGFYEKIGFVDNPDLNGFIKKVLVSPKREPKA